MTPERGQASRPARGDASPTTRGDRNARQNAHLTTLMSRSRWSLAPLLVGCVLISALAGCGVTYTSPDVIENDPDTPVTVIPLDPTTVAQANRSPYTPRALPGEFFAIANQPGLIGAGAIPVAPDVPTVLPETQVLAPPPPVTPGPYRIGVGDVLLLATRGNADTVQQLAGLLAAQNQRQGYVVRDDGAITIPEVGAVELAGLTLQEAEDRLFATLVQERIDPTFSLEVSEFNSRRVAIGGAVQNAQLMPITLKPLTLAEAITAANGFSFRDEQFATIRIYRDGELYQIPVEAFLREPALRDTVLVDNDAVYVDTTYDLDRAFQFFERQIDIFGLRSTARLNALRTAQAEADIQRTALQERRAVFQRRLELDALERDYVYLAGEVANQTRVALPFERKATLADVLYDEGGFSTATGDASEIYVLRGNFHGDKLGAVTAYHLDAKNIANVIIATKMEMRPNDVVFIEEQVITKWGRSLQQALPIFLNEALTFTP